MNGDCAPGLLAGNYTLRITVIRVVATVRRTLQFLEQAATAGVSHFGSWQAEVQPLVLIASFTQSSLNVSYLEHHLSACLLLNYFFLWVLLPFLFWFVRYLISFMFLVVVAHNMDCIMLLRKNLWT